MRIKEFLVSIFSLSTHEIVVETQNSVMDIFLPSKAWIYRCTNWLNVWWEKWNEQRQEEREMRNGCAFEAVIKCIGMQNFNCKDKQNCPLWINRSVAQSLTQMCNISSMVCPHTFINYTKQGLAAVLRFAINLHSTYLDTVFGTNAPIFNRFRLEINMFCKHTHTSVVAFNYISFSVRTYAQLSLLCNVGCDYWILRTISDHCTKFFSFINKQIKALFSF